MVPIGSLLPADSPRLAGEIEEHVRTLAESDAALPPIVVHHSTMRVVDGMHRLRAAALRGDRHIEVGLVEGTAEDAFVLAVRLNAEHGLPLSRQDRTAAALRIIESHPHWSDRRIASVTGLSPGAVGALRGRADAPVTLAQAHVPPVRLRGLDHPGHVEDGRRSTAEEVQRARGHDPHSTVTPPGRATAPEPRWVKGRHGYRSG